MLLPSDLARLVLGYLQQEGLSSTSKEFIHESPNLKEYAEYCTDDGTIPACVFSLLGKNLSTILNEYVAAKAKDMSQEIQINSPMMSSLWKKLEVTLGQIKAMQNSPAVNHQNQRVRTRNGIVNIRRQNALSASPSPSHSLLTSPVPPVVFAIQNPHGTPQGMLGNAAVSHTIANHTAASHTAQQTRASPLCGMQTQIQDGGRLLIDVSRDSPVHVMVPENRLTPGPMSPARRRWEGPRRRGGGASGSGGTGRPLAAEPQSEEAVSENFPQMVIQSAREKILGDRCLQEKLAENINKILSSDPSPQASKASCSSMVVPDPSIDEILGLQGEIHMSDDAIHDILEQTESDPAFQALFDLFDYGKSKAGESTEQAAAFGSASLVESNDTESPATANLPETAEQSIVHKDAASAHESASTIGSTKPGHKAKNKRKTAPTTSRPRKAIVPTLLSVCDNEPTEALSLDSERGNTDSAPNDDGAAMDIDQPEITAAPMTTPAPGIAASPQITAPPGIAHPAITAFPLIAPSPQITAPQEIAAPLKTLAPQTMFTTVSQVSTSSSSTTPTGLNTQKEDTRTSTRVSKPPRNKMRPTQGGAEGKQGTGSALSKILPFHRTFAGSVSTPVAQSQLNKAPVQNACLPHVSLSAPSSAGIAPNEPFTITVPAVATSMPALPTVHPSTPAKDAVDPSKIVSLKIIISDEQEDAADSSLNQAVNSISGDRIPTIFLSSPAKAPPAPAGTPTGQEETALAVSSLQSIDVPQPGTPLAAHRGNMQQPASQPSYIIQLPFDSTNPTFGGAAATSYFLVTDPSSSDPQASNMVLSNGVIPPTSYALATPPRSQTYSTGSTLIISSPVQPMLQNMMVPVSVMNNGGAIQMVSNKFVAMPKPAPSPAKQPEPVKPLQPASKDSTALSKTGATESPVVTNTAQPSDKVGPPRVAAGTSPSHRRMLCFGSSSAESPTQPRSTMPSKPQAAGTPLSPPSQLTMKDSPKKASVKPAILAGNKPKRRIETVRCTDNAQTTWSATETEKSSPGQQKKSRKDRHSQKVTDLSESSSQGASSSNAEASQPEQSKSSKSRRSQSLDKKDEGRRRSKEAPSTRSSSSDHRLRSSSRKDEKESKQEVSEKGVSKSREGRTEKKTSSQESPVTANKENEAKGRTEHQPSPTAASRDLSPPPVTPPTPTLQVLPGKTPTKTSSLAKQAVEMLQDIQALDPPSTPPKRPGPGCPDMPLPRTPGSSRLQEESMDCTRTPSRQRQGEDGESTPRRLLPPPTPDLPTCSPASEAGSENNINMAAHTLMILSRSAIARTGTPLKDSLRQEGAGTKTPEAPKSKKRKLPEPQVQVSPCPPSKKEAKLSGSSSSKKKAKKQKKLLDSFHDDFPDDLDVDKFLSSLHYDE